ncbi:MAG: Coq4 family protein [Myxococcota bacterium]|nr:Coq4 family protein [Myxococcota bacterium]
MQGKAAPYVPPRNPLRLGDAWRALRKLIADPDGTEQVFIIIDALSGNSGERGFQRFAQTPVGRRTLEEETDILDLLSDRESLHGLPPGSLGKTYANFMTDEQISADGLVAASEDGGRLLRDNGDRARLGMRMRDSHDLWHCVTGYSRDLVGEASLLAFTFAQTRNPGVGAIVAMAYLKAGAIPGARKSISQGYRRGRQAKWLPAADWENLLARPLEDVRAELEVGPAPSYTEMRSEAGEMALKPN